MFYVSSQKGYLIGVTDTEDDVEGFFKPLDLLKYERLGFKIIGINHENGRIYFIPFNKSLIQILGMELGSPLKIKISDGVDYEQVLYIGKKVKANTCEFMFYDDGGIEGFLKLSSHYIIENNIVFDFDNNDIQRVMTLQRRYQDMGEIV